MNSDPATKIQKENKKLEVFLGKWSTTGQIYENEKVIGKIEAVDAYEWLPGQYAMIHHIDSSMGSSKIHGIEIIGYNLLRKAFFTPFFDDQGSAGWETLRFENGTWIWNGENVMGVKHHRCIATFQNKNTITAIHQQSEDRRTWKKWMEITLKKME